MHCLVVVTVFVISAKSPFRSW